MISHVTCLPGNEKFKDFSELPSRLYDDPGFKTGDIPHTFLLNCIIVYKDKQPVARTAVYQNPHLRIENEKILLAGAFECIDDESVARYLFAIVEKISVAHGCRFIVGPMNGTTWEDYRLPLSTNHRWFFTETKYLSYYPRLWESAGFRAFHKYYSSIADINDSYDIDIPGSKIRNIDLARFDEELGAIYDMSMKSFTENVFFSPIEREQFIAKYQQLKRFIDPDFVFISEGNTGQTSALLLCLPDILDPSGSTLIIKTIAKDPSAHKGVITEMLVKLHKKAFEKGYRRMIHAFMHETNRSNKLSRLFGGEVFREYAVYIKPIH